jgi:hypothetical protein
VAQTDFQFRRNQAIDLLSVRGRRMLGPDRSSNFRRLAVQLTLDPAVRSLGFVASLPLAAEEVAVGMLVAERDEGSVAYDIVDERPHRDIDSEGLLLIALEKHGITRVEVDARLIGSEPLGSNCKRIWKHRDVEVGADLRVKIDGALEARRLSVRGLGRATKMRSAMATVCALICRRVLYTELSTAFGPASWVARRSDRGNGPPPSAAPKRQAEPVRVLSGEAKR